MRRRGIEVANMRVDKDVAEYAEITAKVLESETDQRLKDTLFLALITLISKRAKPRDQGACDDDYGRISSIAAYITEHYDEDITLDILAKMVGYSKRHLTRLFRRYYGCSIMDHLPRVRLARAAEMLLSVSSSVSEIARLCGFGSASALSESFKEGYGVSPTEYKERALQRVGSVGLLGDAAIG